MNTFSADNADDTDMRKLMKNCAADAATANRAFPQAIRDYSCLFAVKKRVESVIIRVIRGEKISRTNYPK
jgi:hypothetical protein